MPSIPQSQHIVTAVRTRESRAEKKMIGEHQVIADHVEGYYGTHVLLYDRYSERSWVPGLSTMAPPLDVTLSPHLLGELWKREFGYGVAPYSNLSQWVFKLCTREAQGDLNPLERQVLATLRTKGVTVEEGTFYLAPPNGGPKLEQDGTRAKEAHVLFARRVEKAVRSDEQECGGVVSFEGVEFEFLLPALSWRADISTQENKINRELKGYRIATRRESLALVQSLMQEHSDYELSRAKAYLTECHVRDHSGSIHIANDWLVVGKRNGAASDMSVLLVREIGRDPKWLNWQLRRQTQAVIAKVCVQLDHGRYEAYPAESGNLEVRLTFFNVDRFQGGLARKAALLVQEVNHELKLLDNLPRNWSGATLTGRALPEGSDNVSVRFTPALKPGYGHYGLGRNRYVEPDLVILAAAFNRLLHGFPRGFRLERDVQGWPNQASRNVDPGINFWRGGEIQTSGCVVCETPTGIQRVEANQLNNIVKYEAERGEDDISSTTPGHLIPTPVRIKI